MLSSIRSAIEKLANQQKANSQSKSHIAGYQQSIIRMLVDLRFDQHEVNALQKQQKGLLLNPKEVHTVHCEIVGNLIEQLFQDGMLTQDELIALDQIKTILKVSNAHLSVHQLQRVRLAATVIGIQNGILPNIEPGQSRIYLPADEVLHTQLPCQILDERTYRQFVGGSSGFSFRIARGVSYRVGSSRGRSIPVTEIVPVDSGTFMVTSKRLSFVGQRQNFGFEWKKIIGIEPMYDGLVIASSSRKKSAIIKYGASDYNEIIEAVILYYLNNQ